ncbi:MAG: sugar ABC transporter substrate-binding protein [Methyloligellaceae bacterium]
MKKVMLIAASAFIFSGVAQAAPENVSGPGVEASCFKPWDADTKHFKYKAKKGPYKVALANGFIANSWRIQMIQTAKAYAEQPEVKKLIKEFKVISTGEDLPAQVAAVENFINSGYDAVIVNALNPAAFKPVVKKANRAGVILLSFDNVIESPEALMVNVDQVEIGRQMARFLIEKVKKADAKVIEVRGPSGNSVDRDRHNGFHEALKKKGVKWEIVETVGKWDDGTAQKAVADAIAVHKKFDGIYVQAGSTGAVRALIDAKHAMIPVAGETENGFRKLCGKHGNAGLHCASSGTGPAQVAVTIKAALAALQGNVLPQAIKLPISTTVTPDFKDGKNYFSNLSDNFFVGNAFPDCKIGFTAKEIKAQSKDNN